LNAKDADDLVAEIRNAPGWFAHRAGDLQHRYVFCWRWKEPDTPVLFTYSRSHWLTVRAKWEQHLGVTKPPPK
jgi:isoleucyl-tRNA synthetase